MKRLFLLLIFTLLLSAGLALANVITVPFIDLAENKPVTDAEFLAELLNADIILLGERHGRAAFQDRERQILEALALGGVYPALVFEMLQPSQMPTLEQHRADHPEAASGLGAALEWWDTGWPAWSFYQPIFELAYLARLPIVAGDLNDADQLAAKEFERRGPEGLDLYPFGSETRGSRIHGSWLDSLERAHCGLVERSELEDRASLQVARDQALAIAVARAAQGLGPDQNLPRTAGAIKQPVVLIAGSAHTRLDRGVGAYLADYMPEAKIVTIVMRERTWETQGVGEDEVPGVLGQTYDYQWSVVVDEVKPGQCQKLRDAGLIPE